MVILLEREKMSETSSLKLPSLELLKFGNIYSGSHCNFSFKIFPEVSDFKFKVFVWLGLNCFEKSEPVNSKEFDLDEEGLIKAQSWLLNEFESVSSSV